jgi:hypothetical protein
MRGHGLSLFIIAGVFLLAMVATPISSQESEAYDPWRDFNDDGIIDVNDLYLLAIVYGTTGEAINKTALLLELQDKVNSLDASLLALEARINALEAPGSVTTERLVDGAVTHIKLGSDVLPVYSVSAITEVTTSSTDWVDVPEMTIEITLTRYSRLMYIYTVSAKQDTAGQMAFARVILDGSWPTYSVSTIAPSIEYSSGHTHGTWWRYTNHVVVTPSVRAPGTYTVKLQWTVSGGTARMQGRNLEIIVLPA